MISLIFSVITFAVMCVVIDIWDYAKDERNRAETILKNADDILINARSVNDASDKALEEVTEFLNREKAAFEIAKKHLAECEALAENHRNFYSRISND